jgi:hypothetical protein
MPHEPHDRKNVCPRFPKTEYPRYDVTNVARSIRATSEVLEYGRVVGSGGCRVIVIRLPDEIRTLFRLAAIFVAWLQHARLKAHCAICDFSPSREIPKRRCIYNAKDAFRMGNYSLLGYVGGNIAIEFLYSGPHSLLSRMHLNNGRGAPDPGSNP